MFLIVNFVDSNTTYSIFIGFRKKYKVTTYEDVLKIMENIKDKNIKSKFFGFVKYFKTDIKSKRHGISQLYSEGNEKEMIEEITMFVESKDFKKFNKRCNSLLFLISNLQISILRTLKQRTMEKNLIENQRTLR